MKSWVEISRGRLVGNFGAVRAAVGAEVEVLGVVKAHAYGHGIGVCAPALVEGGACWLGVSDVVEGRILRDVLGADATRVLVMCGIEAADAHAVVELDLTPAVWMPEQVLALEEAAWAAGKDVRVHVEIETGMARQGAAVGAELAEVLRALAACGHVRCEGVMTHLCCAEVAGANTTAHAMTLFAAGVQQVADAGFAPQWLHVGNTSAVDEGSTMEQVRALAASVRAQAMVRTGFALYGHCFPVERGVGALSVQPVMTWKTRVVALRTVAAGTTVGYGATFVAEREMTLALLQVGYADGFTRAASSGVGDGWVMLAGERAAVVGRVSMNLTVVDVTRMHVRVGDEAVLLGEGVSAEDHARWSGTIAYDVLCGVRAGSILTSE